MKTSRCRSLNGMALAVALLCCRDGLWADEAGQKKLTVPRPAIFMWGYSDSSRSSHDKLWAETLRTVNIIEGLTSNAKFVRELREEGKVFAWHVVNKTEEGDSVDSIVEKWSTPYRNTLGGKLPGGFDAISIDELHPWPDGDARSELVIKALAELKRCYPGKLVLAAVRWQLAASGLKRVKGEVYDRQLRAIRDNVDLVFLECYLNEVNPQFHLFSELAANIERRAPGIIDKTIYGLGIPQNKPFPYGDSSPYVEFGDYLDKQIYTIRNDPLAAKMPGIGYWVFYRAKSTTVQHVLNLSRHYYIEGRKSFYGDGDYSSMVKSPSFEKGLAGWKVKGKGAEVISYKEVPDIPPWHSAKFASHGKRLLRTIASEKEDCEVSQEIALEPETTYILTAWVAAPLGTRVSLSYWFNTKISPDLRFGGGGGSIGSISCGISSKGEPKYHWTRLSSPITTVPGTTGVTITLRGRAGKPIYYDFIELERGYPDLR
jgi:hypothetical protein